MKELTFELNKSLETDIVVAGGGVAGCAAALSAARNGAKVMLIESGHILHTCENHCGFHGQLIFNLMKDLAKKTLRYHKKIEITSKRSTREKLMTYLLFEAERAGADSFEIPFDRQELADYLDVDRSGLSAEISKLRREGVLECEKSRFVLL